MTEIVVALIAAGSSILVGLLTFVGVIITNSKANKKIENQLAVSQAVTESKLDSLTKQVEKHNKVIERVYNLEKQEELIEEKLKVANNRIHDLEEYHK